jgi:hypothetical protein
MLGERVGTFHGHSAVQRVLHAEGHAPKFETTFQAVGNIIGVHARIIGTYWTIMHPDGVFYGETSGDSVTITKDGETALFRGTGSGRCAGFGVPVSIRGALHYQAARGKLAPLNGKAILYEWEEDENENLHIEMWEWK